MKKYIYLLPFLSLVFFSCEKAFMKEEITDSPRENFEYLWKQCDENYSFFIYKNIDWDAVKSKYAAQISEDMTDQELFDVLANMMNELQDGHVNLSSPFDVSVYTGYYENSPENFDSRIIQEYYTGYEVTHTGVFSHAKIIGHDNIAYVRLGTFANPITDYMIDYIVDLYKDNTDGMILDVRNNGGGLSTNVYELGARFTNKSIPVFHAYLKNGPAHDDFTDKEEASIDPEGSFYDKPIMLLTNRHSYSATSFFSTAMKSFDNVVQIGDSTGGGLGAPNGGELPNGWTYRMSVTKSTTPAGDLYEYGVPADIFVDMDNSDLTKDEIIERAIQEIESLNP